MCYLSLVPTEAPVKFHAETVSSTVVKVSWNPPMVDSWNGDLLGYKVKLIHALPRNAFYSVLRTMEISHTYQYWLYYLCHGCVRSHDTVGSLAHGVIISRPTGKMQTHWQNPDPKVGTQSSSHCNT